MGEGTKRVSNHWLLPQMDVNLPALGQDEIRSEELLLGMGGKQPKRVDHHTLLLSGHYQGSGLDVEQLWHEVAPI